MARTRKHLTLNDHDWAYIEDGNLDKPKLFLIHGGFGYADHYYKLLELVKENYHVIIPDLPGFGLTKSLIPNTCNNIACQFKQFVQHFGPDSAMVFASSMGGAVTMAALLEEPKLFTHAFIQSPMWNKDALGNKPVEIVEKQLANIPSKFLGIIQDPQITPLFLRFISRIGPERQAVLSSENQIVAEAIQLLDINGFQELFHSIVNDSLALELAQTKLDLPLTFLAGDKDFSVRPDRTAALAKMLAKPMILVPDVGHEMILNGPEKIANLIESIIIKENG